MVFVERVRSFRTHLVYSADVEDYCTSAQILQSNDPSLTLGLDIFNLNELQRTKKEKQNAIVDDFFNVRVCFQKGISNVIT